MRILVKLPLILAAFVLTISCKKEVEKIVVQEVDKTCSWTEIKRLYSTDKVVLSMAQDASSIYMQQPGALGILSPAKRKNAYYFTAGVYLPTDISIRVPIAPDFMAFPLRGDTLVQFIRPTDPVTSSTGTYPNLRQLDRQAQGFADVTTSWLPFGAINRHNFLLFGYRTNTYADMRFVLTKVNLTAGGQLQAQPRVVTVAPQANTAYSSIRWIVAIDDYFLVDCDAGLYKIREDGSAKRVFAPTTTDGCYKWQGALYAVEEYNAILKSTDDGETWQRYQGTPDAFTFTSCHAIGDSLVGVSHGGNTLFTLRWNGLRYSLRALKNDGLGQGSISGIQQLGDTVYLGTTSGLFKRPLSKFFETKQ